MKPSDLDASKIEFTQLKKLDNGANVMYLNYNSGPIYFKTPDLEVPFDCQYWPDSGDNSGKWAIKVNLKGDSTDSMVKALKSMDEVIKAEALKNCTAWFKKRNMSAETVETLYTPMVKESLDAETGEPNGKYPPSFAFKIVKRDGNVNCKVFGEDRKVFNVANQSDEDYTSIEDLVKKGSKVKLLIRCNGLWIANGKFGCTWRAEQMKVTRAASFDDCVFGDSDDEEDTVEKIDGNFVESEDDDEDETTSDKEEVEEQETVEDKPKKVRKVRKAK
tara:strand:+ start:942 stop:1766 length:825 start_codon:yes stop_codon:yes gene_type:complete